MTTVAELEQDLQGQEALNPPTTQRKRSRWTTVGILSLVQLTENSEGGLINTVFPLIQKDLGLGLGELGILTSIGKFARMIFGPLWAILGDKFGRKAILVLTALWGGWMVLAGFAQDFTSLAILYGIGVLGTVAGEPISNGLVADLFKADERGKVYGTMRSVMGLGSVVITPLLGQLAGFGDVGWRYGMFIMGGIGVASGILTWFLVTDPKHEVSDQAFRAAATAEKRNAEGFSVRNAVGLLRIPTIGLLAIQLIFVTSLVLFAFQVVFLTKVREYSVQDATGIVSVFFLGFMISSYLGGRLGDRFARWNPRTGRITMWQLYCVAFAALSYLTLQLDLPKGPVEVGAWFAFGLIASLGFSGVVLPMVSTVVLPQYRGTAFALLFSLIQGFFAAIMSLFLGGWAQAIGLRPVLLILVTGAYAVNAVYWFLFYRVYPKDQERMQAQLAAQSA